MGVKSEKKARLIPLPDVPKRYSCNDEGVKRKGEEEDIQITHKPVGVTAISKDEDSTNWGRLVKWKDLDDETHEVAIPSKLFHATGTELAQQLADGGLPIVPGREKDLLRYLAAYNPDQRMVSASCTGWAKEAFVLPNETINEPEGQKIVYQPGGFSNISKALHSAGTLEDWQTGIADASQMVVFEICAALSAPIRFRVGVEAGGFHGYGSTSQGKTTVLQAAASVWGNGVDPAIAGGNESVIHRWNSTANALEAKAVSFNDLPMCLDEIGEGDAREFGSTIYRLLSGTGRGRSNKHGGLRDSASWRIAVLSMGEISISDFIESGGNRIKGGQLVRMVDIDLSSMPPLFESAAEADTMKTLCATHYGHAGPDMLKHVPDLSAGWSDFRHSQIGLATTSITERVRTRFSLVAHAGLTAISASILPWTEAMVMEAVKAAYTAWQGHLDIVSDIDRGIIAVRDFILRNGALFETDPDKPPTNRVGWFRDGRYHFTPSAFKEACGGVDPTKVKRALADKKLLHRNKKGSLNAVITVGGKSTSVVSVKSDIHSDLSEISGNSGNGGSSPVIARISAVTT